LAWALCLQIQAEKIKRREGVGVKSEIVERDGGAMVKGGRLTIPGK
jgi:hypothetical protein